MSIVLDRLSKRFGSQTVVSRVSLEIEDGELFVLLGASGSGKSTVLRLIAGLSVPDSGTIQLRGRDVTDLAPQEREIGFVFQNYSIFRHMSVAENIEFPLKIRRVPAAERTRRREELLDLVGLGGLGGRYAHQLSGGQQQRVALARSLAHKPSVLLLDEPFGALDVKIRGQLRRNLREIQQKLKVTAILVTHDQEEGFELADRVGLMDRGALLEVGHPETLYAKPRTLFGATFLGAGTVLVGRARGNEARLGDLALPIPPEVEHEEGSRVRVLFRPEQVELGTAQPAEGAEAGRHPLGKGEIVEQSFLGALRRLRVRLPPIPGTRQAAPAPYGEEGLLVDVVQPAEEPLPGPEVWVSLRGWHILAPPRPRLLICALPAPAAYPPVLPHLVEAVDAVPILLAVDEDGDEKGTEELRTAVLERAAAGGSGALDGAEVLVRRGDPAAEIGSEQAQSLYDFVVLSGATGPVVGGLLDRLSTALLVLRGDKPTLQRILICTAVGEPGKADVRVGGWLARRLGAEVTLLHVNVRIGGLGGPPEPWVQSHLDRGVATLRALEVKSRSTIRRARTPAEGILAEAAEGQYDLIVMGRHAPRRGPLFGAKSADITLRILAGTKTSMLIVPADE
ncbi:MAG TPA: ATP-binding cassette domain-containing protein [Thermoanaerobaculia bacterium]|jgi:sulfate transport system ATP-binding protein|nr:ATP-binding cassette domain-containing protein [Thermoanaerobaculia bacterium]